MKHQEPTKRLIAGLTVLLCIGLCLLLIWFVGGQYNKWLKTSEIFSIDDIQIEGNDFVSREEILEMGNFIEPSSIWNVDLVKAQLRMQNHPFLEKVTIKRSFPNKIFISIARRRI